MIYRTPLKITYGDVSFVNKDILYYYYYYFLSFHFISFHFTLLIFLWFMNPEQRANSLGLRYPGSF